MFFERINHLGTKTIRTTKNKDFMKIEIPEIPNLTKLDSPLFKGEISEEQSGTLNNERLNFKTESIQ